MSSIVNRNNDSRADCARVYESHQANFQKPNDAPPHKNSLVPTVYRSSPKFPHKTSSKPCQTMPPKSFTQTSINQFLVNKCMFPT